MEVVEDEGWMKEKCEEREEKLLKKGWQNARKVLT